MTHWCLDVFKKWRSEYDTLSYDDQMEFWNWIDDEQPDQAHFNPIAAGKFFDSLGGNLSVMEFGGWKGDCAKLVLSRTPNITKWVNYDICPQVLDKQHCKDPRYSVVVPDKYVWEIDLPDDFNVFIATHSIEHIKEHELISLIHKIPKSVKHALLEAPIPFDIVGNTWEIEPCAHILECGFNQVNQYMRSVGFVPEQLSSEKNSVWRYDRE